MLRKDGRRAGGGGGGGGGGLVTVPNQHCSCLCFAAETVWRSESARRYFFIWF